MSQRQGASTSTKQNSNGNKSAPSGEGIWNKILNDVVKRETQTDSTMLILGDKGAGKRSIVNAIN